MRPLSAPGCTAAPMLALRSDGELLSRFAAAGDEAAFEALVERYAPMVWSVCWRVLHHQQDAEGAFQQTLLVAMRKAKSICNGEAFKGWLRSVAYRTAKDFRNSRDWRKEHESSCDPETQFTQFGGDLEEQELRDLVYTELQKVPEKYRVPFVMCCLEGKSETETAAELGLTKGQVASRVRKAREILTPRLARHGYHPPGQRD